MSILIGGGTGLIGSSLVKHLTAKGIVCNVITRSPKLPNHLSWTDIEEKGLPADTQAVINLNGRSIGELNPLFHISSHYAAFKKDCYASRVDTTRLLANAVRAASKTPKTFIVSSALSMYAPSFSKVYDEDSPVRSDQDSWIFQMTNDVESIAKELDGFNDVVKSYSLRIGIVLAKDSAILSSMYYPFLLGLGGPIGSGRQFMSCIHVDDMAAIIDWLAGDQRAAQIPSGPINCSSPHTQLTNSQFAKAFAGALNRPAFLPMPAFSLWLSYQDRVNTFVDSISIEPKRLLESGFTFKYPKISDIFAKIYK